MDCLLSQMQSALSIALMLDCGGRQAAAWGEGEKERGEKESECCRNASPGSLRRAGAGLQECSPGDPE